MVQSKPAYKCGVRLGKQMVLDILKQGKCQEKVFLQLQHLETTVSKPTQEELPSELGFRYGVKLGFREWREHHSQSYNAYRKWNKDNPGCWDLMAKAQQKTQEMSDANYLRRA